MYGWHLYPSLLTELTHWPLRDVVVIFKIMISEHMSQIKLMSTSCEIAVRGMQHNTFDNLGNICSDIGLVQ